MENCIEDNKYRYYSNGMIYHKRLHRWSGFSKNKGYLQIGINGKNKRVHRIIYEKFIGKILDGYVIDHINNIRDDNRVENLQLLTNQQNTQKQIIKSNNTSGYTGISFYKRDNCWCVEISKNGKHMFYKSGFKTKEDANDARNNFIDDNPELCKYFIKN